jgi:hypothetical protein
MGKEARARRLRWRAYSYAATAAAIRIGKIVPVGNISLAENYREDRLEAVGLELGLDMKSFKIPGSAAIALNWGMMAAHMVGQPAEDFTDLTIVELPVPQVPYGAALLRKHFPSVEILASVLLRLGQLSEAEAVDLLDHVPHAPPHMLSEIGPIRVPPVQEPIQEAARHVISRPPVTH